MNDNISNNDDKELLWKDYANLSGLNKFYIDIIIKLGIFFFGITGALVSYILVNNTKFYLVKYALVIPIFISLGLTGIFISTMSSSRGISKRMQSIRNKLNLGELNDNKVLRNIVLVSAFTYFLIAMGLIYLLLYLHYSHNCC